MLSSRLMLSTYASRVDGVNHLDSNGTMVLTTRETIVAAAAALLDEGGPAAVTFRAVGERVGLSHNAAFKLFRDKDSLLAAVASRELRLQDEALRRSAEPGFDPAAELQRRTYGYVRWALRSPARFKLTFGSWRKENAELGEVAAAARRAFVELVRATQATGAIVDGDPDRVASLILATAHGAAALALDRHLSREGKWAADPEDLIGDLFALLKRG